MTGEGSPEEGRTLKTTFVFLPMLGVHPCPGRFFASSDGQPASPGVVVLGTCYSGAGSGSRTPAHFLRILSMAFPLANSSTSLSR
jgi:hypothetical protein